MSSTRGHSPGVPGEFAASAGDLADVSVVDRTGAFGLGSAAWLADRARSAIALLGRVGEVRVALVGDAEMAEAHERYRGEAGPTDVLTFDMTEGASASSGAALDVDMLVCVDEASRRATALGHDVAREVLLYVIHGVLHTAGYDDVDEASAEAMHAMEDSLLERMGIGATYARKAEGET